ncbi:MFS transporter, partial [Corynebacterium falsenii]|uniref:MFS transporter n=1 Tax=Corynebacterium falsenii TaxID=108486 RepID=UPI0023F37B3A
MPSLPQIAVDYSTRAPMAQLGITFFMLGMGLGQVLIGPLSDERGRRKLLISGMILAVAASIVCAVAPTIEVFIAGRLLQGTAGGVGVVLARAIVGDRVSGARAAKAYAVMMTVVGVAPVIAPLIGAAVAGVFHWRAVFWLLVIIAVAQLLVALRLPESLPPDQRAGTGVAGTFRNMGGLLTVRPFVANLVVFGLGFGAMFSFISGSSVVLQQQLGLSAGMYSVV